MTSLVGEVVELDIGGAAAGGSCVGRLADGRVVFVRHSLPGERVRARITGDEGGAYARAEAVEILAASPDRVEPPCEHARPGRCGGCDWQHATPTAQRRLKADVVRDQFARIARLPIELDAAEELPGGMLGWRTRIAWAVGADGTVGLHRHRSREIEPVACCPLGVPAVVRAPADLPAGLTTCEAVTADDSGHHSGHESGHDGGAALVAHHSVAGRRTPHGRGRRPAERRELLRGPAKVRRRVTAGAVDADFTIDAGGFWQVHPAALPTLAEALLQGLAPRPGDRVVDLYAGAGALTAVLAEAVGATGSVVGLESSRAAVADAAANLAPWPAAVVRHGSVGPAELASLAEAGRVDLVVADPPRAGLGAATTQAVLDLAPRAVGYVSCDAATLARDVRTAVEVGWRLASLRAFDAFPMTAHVECVAVLVPS